MQMLIQVIYIRNDHTYFATNHFVLSCVFEFKSPSCWQHTKKFAIKALFLLMEILLAQTGEADTYLSYIRKAKSPILLLPR